MPFIFYLRMPSRLNHCFIESCTSGLRGCNSYCFWPNYRYLQLLPWTVVSSTPVLMCLKQLLLTTHYNKYYLTISQQWPALSLSLSRFPVLWRWCWSPICPEASSLDSTSSPHPPGWCGQCSTLPPILTNLSVPLNRWVLVLSSQSFLLSIAPRLPSPQFFFLCSQFLLHPSSIILCLSYFSVLHSSLIIFCSLFLNECHEFPKSWEILSKFTFPFFFLVYFVCLFLWRLFWYP